MLKIFILFLCSLGVHGYFTLQGKCPNNIATQDNFKFEDFYGKWHQVYHYSSDGQRKNNCSTVELTSKHGLIHFNVSRVDRGLFHRYSLAKVLPSTGGSQESVLNLEFEYENAPRRLKSRKYQVHILATNYNYYATAYTCQYSPLIDKHFVYLWILSRTPLLNPVSKELALKPLRQIGIAEEQLVMDDLNKCSPKYYEDQPQEPFTFRYPVPI